MAIKRCLLLSLVLLGLLGNILQSSAFRYVDITATSVIRRHDKLQMVLEPDAPDDKSGFNPDVGEAVSGRDKLWGSVALGLGGVVAGILVTLGSLFMPFTFEDSVIDYTEPTQSLSEVGVAGSSQQDDRKVVQLFAQIISQLRDSYVDPVNTGALFETAVNAM